MKALIFGFTGALVAGTALAVGASILRRPPEPQLSAAAIDSMARVKADSMLAHAKPDGVRVIDSADVKLPPTEPGEALGKVAEKPVAAIKTVEVTAAPVTVLPAPAKSVAMKEPAAAASTTVPVKSAGVTSTAKAPAGTPAPPTAQSPAEKRIARVFASMAPRDAAKVLEQMSDADIATILGNLSDKQSAGILAKIAPQRVASLSKLGLHTTPGTQ